MILPRVRALLVVPRVAIVLTVAVALTGCMGSRYIPQAAAGQLALMTGGRKIGRVVADERTPPETAELLAEVPRIRAFGSRRGLVESKSYRRYVALHRPYVVWFVNGSQPLAFEPAVYWFPVAGSFAGVGWFKEERAERHRQRLERQGFDAAKRGVTAYSTGGWFRDPVVSSMLEPGPAGIGDLANTVFHESLHATVLVKGQTYFNESLASFVADTMTPQFLRHRFGSRSVEARAYQERLKYYHWYEARLLETYSELEALYEGPLDVPTKLRRKDALLSKLQAELELEVRPNNASLLGVKLYGTGMEDFALLFDVCGRSWPRFIDAVSSLRPQHFGSPHREDVGAVVRNLMAWGCEPLPK